MRARGFASLFIALCASLSANANAKPRAVSLDHCSDQYLLKLAEPEQVLAVSRESDKDYSYMRAAAENHRRIRATPEEALALKPDIVLRQWGGGPDAERAFSRFGAEVVSLGHPGDFEGVRANIRLAARALGHPERGETLIAEMDGRLAALAAQSRNKNVRALYVTPGGMTAGAQTMIDAIFTAGGVLNIAALEGKSYWPPLPGEALILSPPQLIVGGFFNSDAEAANYWSAARHPALERMFAETPTVHLSPDLISCAAWYSVEAAEQIARGGGAP